MVEKETEQHFDTVAKVWEQKVWVNLEEFDKKVIEFINANDQEIALDVGIGTGALAKKLPVKEMYGLDISVNMLTLCADHILRHRLLKGTGKDIPFLDNSFDLVLARNVLKHTDDADLIIAEMHRVLKHNGRIIIIESSALSKDLTEIPTMAMRVVEPYHPRFRSHDELIDLITRKGFKNVEATIYTQAKKWLDKWCKAKNATLQQRKMIFDLYKNAPEAFKIAEAVKLYEDELEVYCEFPWSMIKGYK